MPGTKQCGICGYTGALLAKTECCKQWVCSDDDGSGISFITQCEKSHMEYTLCGYHYRESHKTKNWKDCQQCKDSLNGEIYSYYATNKYNFDPLKNPPEYEPNRCSGCNGIIRMAMEPYLMYGGGIYCARCPGPVINKSKEQQEQQNTDKKRDGEAQAVKGDTQTSPTKNSKTGQASTSAPRKVEKEGKKETEEKGKISAMSKNESAKKDENKETAVDKSEDKGAKQSKGKKGTEEKSKMSLQEFFRISKNKTTKKDENQEATVSKTEEKEVQQSPGKIAPSEVQTSANKEGPSKQESSKGKEELVREAKKDEPSTEQKKKRGRPRKSEALEVSKKGEEDKKDGTSKTPKKRGRPKGSKSQAKEKKNVDEQSGKKEAEKESKQKETEKESKSKNSGKRSTQQVESRSGGLVKKRKAEGDEVEEDDLQALGGNFVYVPKQKVKKTEEKGDYDRKGITFSEEILDKRDFLKDNNDENEGSLSCFKREEGLKENFEKEKSNEDEERGSKKKVGGIKKKMTVESVSKENILE